MPETQNSDSETIIAQNKEEWNRLEFLLQDPEPNIFWINCDTARLKKPLHDAITEHFPQLKPYDIYISEKTESLSRIISYDDKDKITKDTVIHIFGLEEAVKSVDFLGNLNFQRDSFFRKAPAHIVFWADFDTATVLTRKAYDFWSWIVFTFDFTTPDMLLTARQKGFIGILKLEDNEIKMPSKDSVERIRHLEHEWDEFLKSVNGKPFTVKQMRDAVTIAMALAKEYREEGKYTLAIYLLGRALELNPSVIEEIDNGIILNELGLAFHEIGDENQAAFFFEKALTIGLNIYGPNSLDIATVLSNLAVSKITLEDFEKAKELLERALKIYDAKKISHPNKARDLSNLGVVLMNLNQHDLARQLLEQALDINIEYYNEESPNIARVRSILALNYFRTGNLETAKKMLEQVLESDLKNFGENHHVIAEDYFNLGSLSLQLQLDLQAIKYCEKSYDIFKKNFGDNHPKTQLVLNSLQLIYKHGPRQTP